MTQRVIAAASARRRPAESGEVQVVKTLMFGGAAYLLVGDLATPYGVGASLGAIVLAAVLAYLAYRRGLRVRAALLAGGLLGALGWFLSSLVRTNVALASALGVDGSIIASDVLLFGVALFGVIFITRTLALRYRLASVLEAAVILFSAIYTFVAHRDCHLNQPRDVADFIFEHQLGDTSTLFIIVGVGIMVIALAMFLRRQSAAKIVLSMLFALAVSVGTYFLIQGDHLCGEGAVNAYAQAGDGDDKGKPDQDDDDGKGQGGSGEGDQRAGDQGGKGKGGGGGSGQSDNPFGPPPPNDRPQPVALVTFHDDFESKEEVLYFRQQVQSRFDGTHLAYDTSGKYDLDVISTFPTTGPVTAGPGENYAAHDKVPISVFLLADHPQPIGLGQTQELRPTANPDRRLFVAAYEASSYLLTVDASRLLGRKSVPDTWSPEEKEHYLQIPDDPRYEALSDIIVRDADPRFADDDLMKALLIKRWLEKNGYYTLKETHTDESDPTASFLFGSLRGYCVHFAHAAAFLFRSQGIAARVAVGYGVDVRKKSGGSNLLIMGNMAHAWPEIYLDGIGWITFDIYPERSDEPPQQIIDESLESFLGDRARADDDKPWAAETGAPFPWALIGWGLLAALGAAVLALYGVKWWRRLMGRLAPARAAHRAALRAALDGFADLGVVRARGETRERFAERLGHVSPTLAALTMAHLRAALGHPRADAPDEVRTLYAKVRAEVRARTPLGKRLLGALNPVGWCFTR